MRKLVKLGCLFYSFLFSIGVVAQSVVSNRYDSYRGLVMAGYQGWFNAPDDGANRGWHHYAGKNGFCPGLWNRDNHFVVEPGYFTVMLGSSSEDIRLRGRFEIQ